jgi:pimeloyl-ACP methyl ester carboxylesterase
MGRGHRICGEVWGDRPPVYLVHGWGGCRAQMGVFVKPLVSTGYRLIAFDLPSHNDPSRARWLLTTQGLGRLAHYRIPRHRPVPNAAVEFVAAG